ncbi:hypothetical protein CYMTET_22465 [Cymbomonas tetramitiformis]|uniref:Pectate lyase C n=1 Tax=Cymbomonas tetramitiformis TaxID=36881 RepID=A0AAE0L264_9CHLO|nr:hypothetical protein CYMTET_22465 [Cymbomonas tetramitiformis]
MPLFADFDFDDNGFLSPREYGALSKLVQRRFALILESHISSYLFDGSWQRHGNNQQLGRYRPAGGSHGANISKLMDAGASNLLQSHWLSLGNRLVHDPSPSSDISDTGAARAGGRRALTIRSSTSQGPATTVEECSWLEPLDMVDTLLCNDGSLCYPLEDDASWGCCNSRGKRARCPANWPQMCARDFSCGGLSDHCCFEAGDGCDSDGGERPCFLGCADIAYGGGQNGLWVDTTSATCEDYYVFNYCDESGGYGSGWSAKGGAFEDYAENGVSAVEACCACGGGVRSPPPPQPLQPPRPPVPHSPPPLPPLPPPLPTTQITGEALSTALCGADQSRDHWGSPQHLCVALTGITGKPSAHCVATRQITGEALGTALSLNGSTAVIDDAIYGAAQLNSMVADPDAAVILLRTHVALDGPLPAVDRALDVHGSCSDVSSTRCRISGEDAHRLWRVTESGTLRLEALELRAGYTMERGGALHVVWGRVSLHNCLLEGNTALGDGGALHAEGSHVALVSSHVLSNVAWGSAGALQVCCGSALVLDAGTVVEGNIAKKECTVSVEGNSTLLLNRSQVTGNRVETFGGGMCLDDNSTAQLTGSEVAGNSATSAGGMILRGDSTVVLLGGSAVSGNAANDNAGGVQLLTGAATHLWVLEGSVISDNHAFNQAGGVHVYVGSITVLGGSAIARNRAAQGGGIFFTSEGQMVLVDATVADNEAVLNSPGVVAGPVASGGGVYSEQGSVTVQGASAIVRNRATRGGGLFQSSTGRMALVNTTVADNAAEEFGGGLYSEEKATPVSLTGVQLRNNSALSGDGGGMYLTNGASVVLQGESRVEGNSASERGGGLHGCELSSIRVGEASAVRGNLAQWGGGIFIQEGEETIITEGSVVESNQAEQDGGGIYGAPGAEIVVEGGSHVALNHATSGHGGGIFGSMHARLHVRGAGTAVVSNSAQSGNGGGIFACKLGEVNVSNGAEVVDNLAGGAGGGIYTEGLAAVMGGLVARNAAMSTDGGGVHGEAVVLDVSAGVMNNTALEGQGGGIHATGNVSIARGSSVSSNVARSSGGGVSALSNCWIEHSALEGNVVRDGDGGALSGMGPTILHSVFITQNIAGAYGGGVSMGPMAPLQMENGSRVSDNVCGRSAGGIFGFVVVVTSGSLISGNSADEDGGGILIRRSGHLTLEGGSQVTGNYAQEKGGGIRCSTNASAEVRGASLITDNVALKEGGGVSLSHGMHAFTHGGRTVEGGMTIIHVSGQSRIERNSALRYSGGGVSAAPYTRVRMENATLAGNHAKGSSGGGVDAFNSQLELHGINITGNFAYYYGGALMLNQSAARITSTTFARNGAVNSGGAITTTRSTVVLGQPAAECASEAPPACCQRDALSAVGSQVGAGGAGSARAAAGNVSAAASLPELGCGFDVHVVENVALVGSAFYFHETNASATRLVAQGNRMLEGELLFLSRIQVLQCTSPSVIYTDTAPLLMSWSRFVGNEGTGLHTKGGLGIVVSDTQFLLQHSTERGSGMYLEASGVAQVERTAFHSNVASSEGAGLYSEGRLTMAECSFHNNSATTGAAAYLLLQPPANATAVVGLNTELRESTFSANAATNGAVFYMEGAGDEDAWGAETMAESVRLESLRFENNTASGGGAIVYWAPEDLQLSPQVPLLSSALTSPVHRVARCQTAAASAE